MRLRALLALGVVAALLGRARGPGRRRPSRSSSRAASSSWASTAPGTTAEDAIRALLRGPTADERKAGYRTYIPRGTAVRSVTVGGKRATVDMGLKLMQGVKAEGLNARLTQVVYTATGVKPVTSAKVLIQGGTVLGVFPGIDASVPLTRDGLATPKGPPPPAIDPSTGAPTAGVLALQTRLVELGFLPAGTDDGRPGPADHERGAGVPEVGPPRPRRHRGARHARRPRHRRPGRPRSRAGGPGRRVEILLDRQLTLVIENNQVLRVLHVSTGAAATATPPGSYSVTRKELRSWSVPFQVWLPYASYFVGGVAFHEYPEVPAQPASHGCVRVPSFDAKALFDFLSVGTPVRVLSRS